MSDYEYLIVDVFSKRQFNGNPLAVVVDAQGISEPQMQVVAAGFNLSETVFLFPAANAEAVVNARIFTPRRELPFAGHPTIGTAYVISTRLPARETFAIEERVGLIEIETDRDTNGDPLFWLTTPPITFYETLQPDFCARLLGLAAGDIRTEAAPAFVSAGSTLLFVCVQSPDAVDRAELKQQYLKEALGSSDSVGTFVFCRKEPESDADFDVYARMFAPQTGVREDPATGGATGPLAAYMMRYGLLPSDREAAFVSEQGTKMNRQSFLHVRTNPAEGRIKVGGSVVRVARGTLELR